MANIKWSAFPSTTAAAASGDTLVGLHSGDNYQFNISATATGLAITQWDTNKNLNANNVNYGYTTTATAAGTTTLTVASAGLQFFTGSTTQDVRLPATSTLVLGQSYQIKNLSSGTVTVQSSGGNTIQALTQNETVIVTCILLSGTTDTSWSKIYIPASFGGGGVTSATGTADQVLVNGTSGSAQTGAVTLTLPQDIATTSHVTFGAADIGELELTFATIANLTPSTNLILTPSAGGGIQIGNVVQNLSINQGAIPYASASNTMSSLAKDTNSTRYLSNTGTSNNPAWAQVNLGDGVTGTLPVSNGGTGVASTTAYALLAGGTTSTGALQSISGLGTAGQILTSNGAGALPTWQNNGYLTGAVLLAPSGNQTIATNNLTLTAGSYISGSASGGTAGSFVAYPATAAAGSMTLKATATSGFTGIITNASNLSEDTTYILPRLNGAGTSTNIVVTNTLDLQTITGSLTVGSDLHAVNTLSCTGDVFAGEDGSNAAFISYPGTTLSGRIRFYASDSAGNYTNNLTNLSTTAARTWSLPDASGTIALTSSIPTLPLSLANGGTGASLTASNGGIFYCGASAGAILAGTGTANQILMSGSSSAPAWSTAIYPATVTSGSILYASGADVVGQLTPGTGVVTALGVNIGTAGAFVVNGGALGTPSSGTLTSCTGLPLTTGVTGVLPGANGGTGVANTGLTINLGSATTGYVLTSDSSGNATWAANAYLTGAVLLAPSGDQTITAHNLTVSEGNLQAGSSGHAGTLTSFPATASQGSLIVAAANNGAGNFTTTISNATSVGQSQVISIPDSGAATANFTLSASTGGQTIAGGLTVNGGLTLGTALSVPNGGTGVTSATAYAILAGGTTSTGAFQSLATGSAGQILTSGGASALPAWSTATFPTTAGTSGTLLQSNGTNFVNTTATYPGTSGTAGTLLASNGSNWVNTSATYPGSTTVSQLLYSSSTNTVAGLATANSAVLVTNSSGVPAWSSTMTDGQVVIGSTSGTPTAATLTAGANITITNGAGSITIAGTSDGLVATTISGTSQTAAVNTRYIALNASQTTVTLPSTFAVGDVVYLIGGTANTGGWVLTAATGDTIRCISATTAAGGTVTSPAAAGQCIQVVADVANTSWVAMNAMCNGVLLVV